MNNSQNGRDEEYWPHKTKEPLAGGSQERNVPMQTNDPSLPQHGRSPQDRWFRRGK